MIKPICSDGLAERVDKLPAWAREHIAALTRQKEDAVRTLNEFCNNSTPSKISYEEWVVTGERSGPSVKKKYVQTDNLRIEHAGVLLNISVYQNDRIQLKWGPLNNRGSSVALIPQFNMGVDLVAKENMR